jgi:hypothetical protein
MPSGHIRLSSIHLSNTQLGRFTHFVKLESFTPSTSLLLGHLFVCLLVLLMGKRLYALVYDLGMIFFWGGGLWSLNLTQCAIDIWSIICAYDEWACSIKMYRSIYRRNFNLVKEFFWV